MRLFPALLAVLFALQVLVALPQHAFHGASSHAAAQPDSHHSGAPKAPDDSRCDFTLAFVGLDSGSAAQPPALSLHETAFAVVAAYASFQYSSPVLFAQARGPPALS